MSDIDKHLLNQIESSNKFFWLRSRHFLIHKYIVNNSIKNVIDIGAGIGGLGDSLSAEKHVSYYFIEVDKKSVEVLEKKFGEKSNLMKNIIKFDGTKCLTFLDVIEHIKYPDNFLKEYLDNFGSTYVLITVPAYQWLWSNWDLKLGHYRRYTKKSLIDLAEKNGLITIEANYLFPELLVPALVRKIINTSNATFPKMPNYLNNILYFCSILFLKLRKLIPFGLSVFYFGVYKKTL